MVCQCREGGKELTSGNTLALTPTDTTDLIISNQGVRTHLQHIEQSLTFCRMALASRLPRHFPGSKYENRAS